MAREPDGEGTNSWTRQYRRPYAVTKGRTQPVTEGLAVEALVGTTDLGLRSPPANRVQRSIVDLCRQLRSLVEVAAYVELPLGAARVLVSELAQRGLVEIYSPPSDDDWRPDSELLERVLDTLRAL